MPRRDGTGPMGQGAMTGRGLGRCTGANVPAYGIGQGMALGQGFGGRRGFGRGAGRGFGRGLGRGLVVNQTRPTKELLQEQKTILKNELEMIDQQLENL